MVKNKIVGFVIGLLISTVGTGTFFVQYQEYEKVRQECERQMAENRADMERMKQNYENGHTVIYNGEEMSWQEYVITSGNDMWDELRQMVEESKAEKERNKANGVIYLEDYFEYGTTVFTNGSTEGEGQN